MGLRELLRLDGSIRSTGEHPTASRPAHRLDADSDVMISWEAQSEVGISWELTLESIDDAEESFSVELDLKYTWIARGFGDAWKAAGEPAAGSAALAELVGRCWDPNVRVSNVMGEEDVRSNYTMCIDPHTGRMHRFTKLRVTASETLELHRFPFDRQLLSLTLSTYRDTSEVIFVPYEGRSSLNKSTAGRWKLYHASNPMLVVPSPDSLGLSATSGRSYHRCFITIEAERDANWYLTHFILPHCVIITMNANVTLIPRNEVADRNSVTLTLLLTAVAFQFLLVSEVPKKNYQTILDWVMAAGLSVQLVTCLLVFLNADNPHDPSHDRSAFYTLSDDSVSDIEFGFLLVFIVPWIAGNLLLTAMAKFGYYAVSFDKLVHAGQGWLFDALLDADDRYGLPTGDYSLFRCSKKLTELKIRLVKGAVAKKDSQKTVPANADALHA